MRIGDKTVRNAVSIIVNELETMEARMMDLQGEVASLEATVEIRDVEIYGLKNDIAELSEEVKRLDDALADTYIAQLDPKGNRDG